MRLAALVEQFERYNRLNRQPRTADFYRDHLRKVTAVYAELPAEELTPQKMLIFKATWHLIMSVQRLYRWAVEEMEILERNPVAKLRRPRLGARRRVLSPEEMARLLRGAHREFRTYLLFSRETAARPQELTALRWEWLHWDGPITELEEQLKGGRACFVLNDYKGRARRTDQTAARMVPITPRLGRALWRMLMKRPPQGLVLTNPQGRPWNRASLRMRLDRLLVLVELVDKVQGEKVCCYTLRHSAATSLASRGLQTSVLQQLLVHARITTTQKYIHLHRQQLLDTWKDFWSKRRGPGQE